MGLLCCFDGGNSAQRKEEERVASAEAVAKAAEAAQRRQEEFEKSAAGRAARAQQQQQAAAKQAASSNKGEPVLKMKSHLVPQFLFSFLSHLIFTLSAVFIHLQYVSWIANSSCAENNTPDLQRKLLLSIVNHFVICFAYGMSRK
ncbi:hypothetical protein D8674_015368 [Pyrus ussuriensis x Pyrus communis]|uniref:Uncharacterized protein n=1 Tax=Pyrus ussuriensis x Pyrus communis TaxID=2448454 RepID=A0A5N5GV65_9ROSA|nr:hypothetical protein D8674_015368 [Pyrus ussuriensis x Pyrus communis]